LIDKSLDGEQAVYGSIDRSCVFKFLEFNYLADFIKLLSYQGSQSIEMTNDCDSLVLFLVLPEEFFYLPRPRSQLLWRLVYHLRLH
jgi:hypothetical protein